MPVLIFYYLILPFILGWLFIKIVKKYGRREIPPELARLYAEKPLKKGWFRSVRSDSTGAVLLGDYETRPDAVDEIYRRRDQARACGQKASFIVLDHQAEALEEVDS